MLHRLPETPPDLYKPKGSKPKFTLMSIIDVYVGEERQIRRKTMCPSDDGPSNNVPESKRRKQAARVLETEDNPEPFDKRLHKIVTLKPLEKPE